MLTTQQLAEARTHERRRLVTAFVTGAEPEQVAAPPSTGRALLAGLALAVLFAAGSVAVSVSRPTAPPTVAEREPDAPHGHMRLILPSR